MLRVQPQEAIQSRFSPLTSENLTLFLSQLTAVLGVRPALTKPRCFHWASEICPWTLLRQLRWKVKRKYANDKIDVGSS